MSGPGDEFDDFLKQHKPLFKRLSDDEFEPPAELDRLVLRQAREAIEADRPLRVFRAPRWSAPVALAATLLLTFSFFFHAGVPTRAPVPEVSVQTVAQRVEMPAAAPTDPDSNYLAREESAAGGATGPVIVSLGESRAAPAEPAAPMPERRARETAQLADAAPAAEANGVFVSAEEAGRYAAPPPPAAAPSLARSAAAVQADGVSSTSGMVSPAADMPAAKAATPVPAWRRDAKTWLAEIERLRTSGDVARAEEELAEYKRQHRAFAGSPDR